MYKIIGGDGKKYGPVTHANVCEWIYSRRCTPSTLIQAEGASEWKQLSQLPEFATALAGAPIDAPPRLTTPVPARPKSKSNPLVYALVAVGVVFVGIFVIGLLAAIAIPNFVIARKTAQTNVCKQHLAELAQSIRTYAADHNDQLPQAATWSDDIKSGTQPDSFECPAAQGQSCAFAYNKLLAGKKLSRVNPTTVLLFESDAGWDGSGGADQMISRGHSANRESGITPDTRVFHVVFVDGSFASMPESGLSALRWEP